MSVIKRISLYQFTLWGRNLVSAIRIRESPYYRGFFGKKIYENFVGTLETVRNIEVSVLERCPYREVRLNTEEEINTFKENMASENTKKSTSTSVRRMQSWYLEKYKTELNFNSIILIAILKFQCFRLDALFLSVLPPTRKKL